MEENLFEEYYKESFPGAGSSAGEPSRDKKSRDFLDALERDLPPLTRQDRLARDAQVVREPIKLLVGKLNAALSQAYGEEKTKRTRADLVVTMLVGGLAFTMGSVFCLLNEKLGVKISVDEYEKTFTGMFRLSIKNIRKGSA